ncbi:hypothetical protein [Riemerella columbina]|uniref:hypothetical protein n=1 Tax=Riemerella columbina TaxID=103810 RepID=UPI00035D9CA5|nr:hypothetical protein [Riemerella columbina]
MIAIQFLSDIFPYRSPYRVMLNLSLKISNYLELQVYQHWKNGINLYSSEIVVGAVVFIMVLIGFIIYKKFNTKQSISS